MRNALPFAMCCLSMAAHAGERQRRIDFDVPAGSLDRAIPAFGSQADITIGASDPLLVSTRTRGVRGHLTLTAAVARMLAGTGFVARLIPGGGIKIERARAPHSAPGHAAQELVATLPGEDIIVTASKQAAPLNRFAGTVRIVALDDPATVRRGTRGTELILDRLPMLASTNLGPGRNKLYIRGIADSSFNGPSQSIVGQYLGDVRLTFNAPDPDLQLFDMKGAEVLEGPQGTLYGSGSLGGILRLIPNAPDPAGFAASMAAGGLITQHAGTGGDAAAMVNLPIVADTVTLRVVGFGSRTPGYIDDIGRDLSDVNRTTIYGGRATLRWEAGDGWTIELGGLVQYIEGRDGQYALADLPPLTRSSFVAQPFHNDYKLGQLVIRKTWSALELVSATGVVEHDVGADFDATELAVSPVRRIFQERTEVRTLSNETRLSRTGPNGGGWIAGVTLIHDTDTLSRHLGAVDAPPAIPGIRNETTEAALFGQFGYAFNETLVANIGGRLTYSDITGLSSGTPEGEEEAKRHELRMTPSAGMTWRASRGLTFFARYQQGFRAGGLAIAASGSATGARRFRPDALSTVEAGLRSGNQTTDAISFDMTASFSRWRHIQADLLDATSLPFTVNVGNARIFGLEASGVWHLTPAMTVDGSLFLNRGRITSPSPELARFDLLELPNVARIGARFGVRYVVQLSASTSLEFDGSGRYFGKSEPGIGTPIDLKQGDYVDTDVGARLEVRDLGITLDVTNVADVTGNRYSYGNPFSVGSRMEITPLRPRTIRLGFDLRL
jgi:iron complex outermembrane receptor protein